MYKNLSCNLLAISGRQSEIIELALTYGFGGIDIDIDDLEKRCSRTSYESASRFLTSSKLNVAGFDVPVDLDASDEEFATQLAKLNATAEISGRVGATMGYITVPAATDRLPYPEYFEVIRTRVADIAAVLSKEEIRLALTFAPQEAATDEKQFKFVRDTEGFCALIRAVEGENIGIVLDIWAWHLGGGTLEMLKEIGIQRVLSVCLADCKESVEAAAATNDDCLLPASTGVIDCTPYLTAFAEAEMELPIAARGVPAEGPATRDALINLAQDALNRAFEQAGLPTSSRKPEQFAYTPSYSNNKE